MKVIRFVGIIDEETAPPLIKEMEEKLNDLKENEKIHFYVTSEGGSVVEARIILDILNGNIDKFVLIANYMVMSSALRIFSGFRGERRLLGSFTWGLTHLSSLDTGSRDRANPESFDYIRDSYDKSQKSQRASRWADYLKLEPEEKSDFLFGKDVVLMPCKMKEIFEDRNEVFENAL